MIETRLISARHKWQIARAGDVGAIALLTACGLLTATRLLGSTTPWHWGAVVAVVIAAAIPFLRRPTLLAVAQRIDTHGRTSELISSAWLSRTLAADPWTRTVIDHAADRVMAISTDLKWGSLAPGARLALVLLSLSTLMVQSLASPFAASPSTNANSPSPPPAEAPAAVAWVSPSVVHTANDEPDEASRPVTVNQPGNKPVARPAADASGNGRATAGDLTRIPLRSGTNPTAITSPAPSQRASGGNGPATPSDTAAGSEVVQGSVNSAADKPPGSARITGAANDRGGPYVGAAAVGSEYRSLITAYFAR